MIKSLRCKRVPGAGRTRGGCNVSAEVFDWRQPFTGEPFDVVVACDVLYDASAVTPLASRLPEMLSRSDDSQLLLTDMPRRTPALRRRFMEELAAVDGDMMVEMNRIVGAAELPVCEEAADVQLVVLRRRQGGETVGLPLSSVV